ncbi:MAG: prepilin-type N-terminal cleavage/methylation domain-containing protein [Acidobacteria bacterium]|nr:prepilin-type N-terminal cleavage/methylation domain-containing protein [Acidobacteriota bacterium]
MIKKYQAEKGYSLIELLVVVAILAIVMAVAAFSYRTAMRASRVKQGLTDLYDGFSRARSEAIIQNGDITVVYAPGNRTVTFTQNGTVLNRIVFNNTSVDPGNPKDGADYHFEKYTVIRGSTRDGSASVTGLDVDGDGTNDNIPILADSAVNITIQQTGFINGVGNASAVLLMHQADIDDNDSSGERQYALVLFSTGLLKKVRHMSDGSWELF